MEQNNDDSYEVEGEEMTIDEALYNIKQGYGIPYKHDTLTTIIEYVKKTEPCEDAVNRQDILDRMDAYCNANCRYTKAQRETMCRACAMGDAIEIVEDALPVQPKVKTGWIPLSERLPELGQKVLCYCRAKIYDVLKYTMDGWFEDAEHCYMDGFVLAWMPLPEPYRAESEETEC